MKTILDISNALLTTSNLITKEINDYFTNNAFNFTDQNINSQIEELLDNFYNNINYKHLTIYVGYELILKNSDFENTIINKLFLLYDISNKTLTIEEYTQSLFEILMDNEDKINDLDNNFYPLPIETTIFKEYKIISVRENIGDIYNNSLLNKFLNVENMSDNFSDYIYYLNLNIAINFSNFNFKNKTLYDYKIYNANLRNCDFTNCDISNTVLNSCDFSGSLFDNTTFHGVDIRGSNLSSVDLSNCIINSLNATEITEDICQNRLPITHIYNSSLKMIVKNTENLDKKGLAAEKAANAGIPAAAISEINNLSSLENGEVDENLQATIKQHISNFTSEINKLERKHSLLRLLLFKSVDFTKNIIFEKDNLLMPDVFLKDKVSVLEPNRTIIMNNFLYDEGFYVPLEDDEYIILELAFSKLRILINRFGTFNGKGRYSVLKVDGESEITINDFNSHDYFIRQYFEDGETCRINELDLFFGGVGEAEVSLKSDSLGDPYVFPFYGKPTKLPDKQCYYRMLEGKNLFINSYVNKLSSEKMVLMEKWFKKKTGFKDTFGLITGGYFYTDHWICCDDHYIHLDLENKLINVKENMKDFFTIKLNNQIFIEKNKFVLNEKYCKLNISFSSKTHGKIVVTIKFYHNPQIRNGISLHVEKNKRHCKGLLVHNFKPNLMRLESLTKKKDLKQRRRFKKAKRKFSVRELLDKKELYI